MSREPFTPSQLNIKTKNSESTSNDTIKKCNEKKAHPYEIIKNKGWENNTTNNQTGYRKKTDTARHNPK